MRLTSPAFNNGEPLPATYSCDGEGINPELNIEEVPAEARSLALIVDDPDAPADTFVHWLLWNIDPRAAQIPAGFQVPAQIKEGLNGGGEKGFIAACPPAGHGTHHYHFKLYALDAMLNLEENATKEDLEREIETHQIEAAELVGIFSRQNAAA